MGLRSSATELITSCKHNNPSPATMCCKHYRLGEYHVLNCTSKGHKSQRSLLTYSYVRKDNWPGILIWPKDDDGKELVILSILCLTSPQAFSITPLSMIFTTVTRIASKVHHLFEPYNPMNRIFPCYNGHKVVHVNTARGTPCPGWYTWTLSTVLFSNHLFFSVSSYLIT